VWVNYIKILKFKLQQWTVKCVGDRTREMGSKYRRGYPLQNKEKLNTVVLNAEAECSVSYQRKGHGKTS
jgi:hypothetical protein